MTRIINQFFASLSASARQLGAAWNRFWFTPSDPASLCAMRILVGLTALYWLATWTPDLVRFFGAEGLVPAGVAADFPEGGNVRYSPLAQLGSPTQLYVVHAASILIALMLTVGLYARTTSVLTLLVVLMYIHRAPFLTSEMETILVMLLAYLCIAPCGAQFSLDALRARRNAKGGNLEQRGHGMAATIGRRLIQVHLTLVYAMMALAKLNDGVSMPDMQPRGVYNAWWEGEAIWWLAAKPSSALIDFTGLLTNSIHLVNFLTFAVLAFNVLFVVLVWPRLTRIWMLTLSVPIWLGLALVSGLTTFCVLMLVANLAFISSATLRETFRGDSATT